MKVYLKMILPDDFIEKAVKEYSAFSGRSVEDLLGNASGKFNDGDIFDIDLMEIIERRGLNFNDFMNLAFGFMPRPDTTPTPVMRFRLDASSKIGPELSTPGIMEAFMIQNVNTGEWMKNAGGDQGIYFEESTDMAMVISKEHVEEVLKQLTSQTPEFEFKAVPVHDALNLNAE